jgi:hypothetical protein
MVTEIIVDFGRAVNASEADAFRLPTLDMTRST